MPEKKKIFINLQGLSCGSCVSKVEKAVLAVQGVQKVYVNFAEHSALVEGNGFAEENILKKLKQAGYPATLAFGAFEQQKQAESFWGAVRSIPALLLAIWLMGVMHQQMPHAPYSALWHAVNWVSLGVMVFAGLHVYSKLLVSLRRLRADMYTLIGFGTGAAWVYSCIVLYWPEMFPQEARHFHYEAGLFIIAFINLGHFLEMRVRGKVGQAVERLMALVPKKATRVRNGQEEEVALSIVEVGDLLRVRPGDKIPVDGYLEEGSAMLSEAMLTGEPILVNKAVGDHVIAGTENRNGSFIMRAQQVGEGTVLAAITQMVRQAQAAKPAIARTVDQVASAFTYIIFALSVVVGGLWWVYGPEPKVLYVFTVVMTVFVVACPCALGLATPVSVMAGVGRAAKFGILFPKGDALQKLGMANVIVFDKTGTLTKGTPRVVDVLATEGNTLERVLQIATSLAHHATHPLSEAIVQEAAHKEISPLKAHKLEEHPGLGLQANIGGKTYFLGSRKLLEGAKLKAEQFFPEMETFVQQGKTVVFVANEETCLGLLALRDDLRPEAAAAVQALQKQGLEAVILTGDNAIAAKAIGKLAHIHKIVAEQKPQDKLAYIKKLQQAGNTVAMVGDGINDAPALAQADVGITLASGSDIALGASDVVIATEDLRRLPLAVKISRATVRNIKQNLFWAFLYNSAALPIAAGILYPITGQLLPPWVAGGAMALSSLTVVLNALRLNLLKK